MPEKSEKKLPKNEEDNGVERVFVHFPILEGSNVSETIEQMKKSPNWQKLEPNFSNNKDSIDIKDIDTSTLIKIVNIVDNKQILEQLQTGDYAQNDLLLSLIGSGESGSTYSVNVKGKGKCVIKVVETSRPRSPLLHTDKKISFAGKAASGDMYYYYSDLRSYLTLPGENKEVTFMEYGSNNHFGSNEFSSLLFKPLKALRKRKVLEYASKRGLSPVQGNHTFNELNHNRHYLNVDGKIAVIDIPFWKPNQN